MEISSSLNHKTWQPISCIPRTRLYTTKSLKLNTISCQAQGLSMSMQRDTTNLYQVLSLDSENVGFDEIKKAYRSLALQYHPDLYPSARKEESTNKFVELQKAYETLSDPISRRRYDGQLSMAMGASVGFHKERVCTGAGEMNTRLSSRMVWENQLYELQNRSSERMERKKNRCM